MSFAKCNARVKLLAACFINFYLRTIIYFQCKYSLHLNIHFDAGILTNKNIKRKAVLSNVKADFLQTGETKGVEVHQGLLFWGPLNSHCSTILLKLVYETRWSHKIRPKVWKKGILRFYLFQFPNRLILTQIRFRLSTLKDSEKNFINRT